jgi:hypothetical protein
VDGLLGDLEVHVIVEGNPEYHPALFM